jgi:uncharacterized iron-regulated protein
VAAVALVACAPRAEAPAPGTFLRPPDAQAVTFEQVVADLLEARVVYVGERHDEPADHALQHRIIEALHQRDPSLAVGMEMFQEPYQQVLDAWVAGHIDEAELLAGTEYRQRWGYDFGHYRPILEHARQHRVPLVALNAPAELTRAVARQGLAGLDEDARAVLPEVDLDDAAHRALVMDALAAHADDMGEEALERYYEAQVLWDETMAERVARTLAGPGAPHRMVVLAGSMHVRAGLGIPERAARRGAGPYRVVLVADRDADLRATGPGGRLPAHWWWSPPPGLIP